MLEDEFNKAIDDWVKHSECCRYSSMMKYTIESDPMHRIVALGKNALPLIRKVFDRKDLRALQPGLAYAIYNIVGDDFEIPDELSGKTAEVMEYTRTWLDKNLARYAP